MFNCLQSSTSQLTLRTPATLTPRSNTKIDINIYVYTQDLVHYYINPPYFSGLIGIVRIIMYIYILDIDPE